MNKKQILILLLIFIALTITKYEEGFALIVQVNNLQNSNQLMQFSLYVKESSIPD